MAKSKVQLIAERIYSKVQKVSCYDEATGFKCPCFDLELECDVDCKASITRACKALANAGLIKA